MKKYLFLFPLAAIAMTACTNETTEYVGSPQAREISFSPLAQNATRAAVDGETFPAASAMQVAAYQVTPTAANYFAGTEFKKGTTYWEGTTKKYWPLSPAYINFLAYTGVTGTAAFDETTPASKAVITQTDNSSDQADLMYAIGNGEVTQAANALTFPEKVGMKFIHAQAWVNFTVKAATTVEKDIKVNSITLNGAKYAGTYTITHTNYNASSGQSVAGAWTNTTAPAGDNKIKVPGWTAANLDDTKAATVGNGLMIVPDDTEAGDFTSFTINYTYDSKDYDYTYTPTSTSTQVEQAKKYTYAITFKLHEILINPSVTDWDDEGNTTNITIQE